MNFTLILYCVLGAMVFLRAKSFVLPKIPNVHRKPHVSRLPFHGYAFEDLLLEDEDMVNVNKRQQFDDYGHMRFGKRQPFDDYGYMRFGRNHQ